MGHVELVQVGLDHASRTRWVEIGHQVLGNTERWELKSASELTGHWQQASLEVPQAVAALVVHPGSGTDPSPRGIATATAAPYC